MGKIKNIIQHDESDCGIACISFVLHYYGKDVSIRKIREVAGTDKIGTSGLGIIKASKKFGLSCKGIMVNEKEKIVSFPMPAILHLKWDGHEHYVVIYKIKKNVAYINDPTIGLTTESLDSLLKKWSGITFILFPTSKFEKGSDKEGFFSRFLILLRPYKRYIIETFVASIFLSFFGIFMSFYFRFLIDEVLYSQIKSTLNLCSFCYFIIIVFQVLLNFCRSQLLTYMGSKIDVSLVSDFYLHLLKLPLDFFQKRKTGEILSRLNDANIIRNAISSTLLSIAIDAVMIVIGAFFLIKTGSILLPVSIIPVVLSAIIVYVLKKTFKKMITEQARIEAEKNASIYETINGIATVKGLATEDKAFSRTEGRIVEAAQKNLKLQKLGNLQNGIQSFISSCGTLAIYWIGSFMIFQNKLTLGQLISFTTLSGYFIGPLSRLLTMQSYWQEVFVSAERLSDVLDIAEEGEGQKSCIDAENLNGDIEYKKVCFSYGTRGRAVKHVSLKIPAGKKVAFVGMSGSGKSTLLKLLMKFYDYEEGGIFINNKEITEYTNDSYRSRIGYVPQESILFSGTIAENISWGSYGASFEQILQAAQDSQAYDFIDSLPDKFYTIVGEQGATLSGGERQRIALARILMRNPDIIILDEATASLDSISEQKIMKTVYEKIHDKTVIMVAHRLSTIRNCDCIFVFEHGQLVEQGNHDELLKKQGKYYKMWRVQNEKSDCIEAPN